MANNTFEFKGTKTEWHAVDFAGIIFILDSNFYEGKSLLDYDTVGEEVAKSNAQLAITAPELFKKLESILNISEEDHGREGCTYGDTDFSSIDVCYGYNLALQDVKKGIKELLTKATTI